MKKPPKKPEKQILVPCVVYPPDGVSLDHFIRWCSEKKVPINAELKIDKNEDYDMDGNLCSSFPRIELAWNEYQDDPNFDKQMKKYQTKLKKWKKQK